MRRHKKTRTEASRAVIALRHALGKTQQEFAQLLKTAISTIGRWETKDPPKGDALLQLAEAAWRHDQTAICGDFELLFLDETLPRLRKNMLQRIGEDSGYVVCRYDTSRDVPSAAEFLDRSARRLAQPTTKEEKAR